MFICILIYAAQLIYPPAKRQLPTQWSIVISMASLDLQQNLQRLKLKQFQVFFFI